jgi:hypothetical protein
MHRKAAFCMRIMHCKVIKPAVGGAAILLMHGRCFCTQLLPQAQLIVQSVLLPLRGQRQPSLEHAARPPRRVSMLQRQPLLRTLEFLLLLPCLQPTQTRLYLYFFSHNPSDWTLTVLLLGGAVICQGTNTSRHISCSTHRVWNPFHYDPFHYDASSSHSQWQREHDSAALLHAFHVCMYVRA